MLPEEVTKFVGKAGEPRTHKVEPGAIERFADAVDDPNPLYWDEEHAKKSRYGSIMAPPGFFGWPVKLPGGVTPTSPVMGELGDALVKAGYTNPAAIDAGIEYDFFKPVQAGDILTAVQAVKEITEREGKTGKMAFIILETSYTNQKGDLVAKARGTLLRR